METIIDTTAPETTTDVSIEEPKAQPEEREIASMDTQAGETDQPEKTGEPEWQPNYKFKVKDKELEFDDWVKPLVTKETQDKFREVFEKAHGIDAVKQDRQSLREELRAIREEKERIDTSLQYLSQYVQKKDYRSFFEALQIPKEEILRYAIDELKYQEMSPEQRQEIDAYRQNQYRLSQLEMQNQQLMREYESMTQAQKVNELESELSRQDIAEMARSYDARVGEPGAFRKEVISRGAYWESVHGQTISAKQAVDEVLRLVGGTVGSAPQAGAPSQTMTPGQAVVQNRQKPVIPNVQGASGSSPAKKRPGSIEDLRRMREQMLSQG